MLLMSGCQMIYNMQDGHPKRGKRGSCQVTQFPRNFLVLQWDYDNDWTKRAIQRRSSKLDIKLKPNPGPAHVIRPDWCTQILKTKPDRNWKCFYFLSKRVDPNAKTLTQNKFGFLGITIHLTETQRHIWKNCPKPPWNLSWPAQFLW